MTTTAPPTGPVTTNPTIRTISRASEMPTRRGARLPSWVPPVLVFIVIVVLWYFVSYVVIDPKQSFLVPPPHKIFTDAFFDPKTLGDIMEALTRSAGVALTGLAIAIAIGFVWAVAMSQARWIERSLFPYAVILQCIPILALVPLIGFWFGFDFPARVIVCILIALFPIVSNTLFGLQSVDKGQRELFQLQKANRWTVLTKLEFPAALPAIFAGMRISAGLAVVGAIVGDFFFRRGEPGLGALISNYQSRVQGPELFAAIITAALFGVVVFLVFGWLGKLAVGKWYDYSR
ncbi:ABC transporter permease [Agreia sp.]|uniref:ABC transporter permease n=1 Tax=Agreia sp. TaxID=1872416 RepID=UPI0035BC8A84